MEKKRDWVLILLACYFFLLILMNLWPSIYQFKNYPKFFTNLIKYDSFYGSHPGFFIRMISVMILALLKTIVSIFGLLIGFIFVLRYRNWARRLVIYSCLFMLCTTAMHANDTYGIYNALAHNLMFRAAVSSEFSGIFHFFENELSILFFFEMFAGQFLSYLLPIFYLTRPKVKENFMQS